MKRKKHKRTSQKAATRLRQDCARLGGIVTAKNNADAARKSLDDAIAAYNATEVTPFLLVQNGWQAMCNNCKCTMLSKGAFTVKFIKDEHISNKVELIGNYRDNRIELRKPKLTLGTINTIFTIFDYAEQLKPTTLNLF